MIKKKAMEEGTPIPEEVENVPVAPEEQHDSQQKSRDKDGLLTAERKNQMGGAGMGPKDADMVAIFTCSVCETRTAKRFTKHAYTKGIVLVQCPGCTSRHLLADNLGWFEDNEAKNIEAVSYTHLRAHETPEHLVCRLLLEKKKIHDHPSL
eukprot:TRINITY_DN46093_c0_g1_i1.p1 TRINITY_DN46093_c0_g1~~TRINITY_DN46093_c0_g1_i1.p1  ORF type:complete len:151 (+),score=41.73 TRINITY_DN46093_c0_g1_i1:196-648(+)